MRLAISGYRYFNDYETFKEIVDIFIKKNGTPDLLLIGDATGTDALARRYCVDNEISHKIFKADWSLGKKAGPLRNHKMLKSATNLLAFLHPQSKGTVEAINHAQNKGVIVTIHKIV